jgi:N-acetylglucosaminyldiphosphoundecaprenol N-acetyl-beta-D-mannosaminyltransferase
MQQQCAPDAPQVSLLGMPIRHLDETGCVEEVLHSLALGMGGWIITSNTDILRRYVTDPGFRTLAGGASLVVADGMPLIWASILQGSPLPERVSGSNLIYSLSAAAARKGHRIFLIGGDPGTAEAAGGRLAERFPGLVVAGAICPPFGYENNAEEMARMRAELKRARPELVFVALGCPKQERLIETLRAELPATWWIGVGISFSFVCGRVKRAPHWLQRAGLEWAHRLVQEPRRLARRYLLDGIPFALYLLYRSARAHPARIGRLVSSK